MMNSLFSLDVLIVQVYFLRGTTFAVFRNTYQAANKALQFHVNSLGRLMAQGTHIFSMAQLPLIAVTTNSQLKVMADFLIAILFSLSLFISCPFSCRRSIKNLQTS